MHTSASDNLRTSADYLFLTTAFSSIARAVSIMMLAFLLLGCSSGKERKQFTQCVRPINAGITMGPPYHKDAQRGCYGIRWDVPSDYYHTSPGDGALAQNFVLSFPANEFPLARDASPTEPQKVFVRSLLSDFEGRAAEMRQALAVSPGVEKTGSQVQGWDIYAKPLSSGEQEFYLLVPTDPKIQMLIKTWAKPGLAFSEIPLTHTFEVVSNVEDRVYVEYRLRFSDLSQVNEVDRAIVSMVRSFMVD